MLTVSTIKKLLKALSDELALKGVRGELGICGGAVMCLVFKARESTKDVDGIFEPTEAIREASVRIGKKFGLKNGWLNDAAKAYFHVDPPREPVLEFSNLRVWAPRADYMLAMKAISARFDTHDSDDVEFLISYLGLKKPEEVFKVIERYYPAQNIPPKTRFFIEELMEKKNS